MVVYVFCNAWVCLCLVFVMCGCVYVWVFNVLVCECVDFLRVDVLKIVCVFR